MGPAVDFLYTSTSDARRISPPVRRTSKLSYNDPRPVVASHASRARILLIGRRPGGSASLHPRLYAIATLRGAKTNPMMMNLIRGSLKVCRTHLLLLAYVGLTSNSLCNLS